MWFWVFDWSLTFFFILSSSSPSLQENLWKKCCWQTWPSRPPGGLQKRQSTPSIPCWKRTDARTMTLPLAYNPPRHHRLLFKYYTHILAHTSLYSCSATKSTGPSTCSMMMSFSFDPLATRSGKMYVYVVWDLHLHLHGNLCFSSFLFGSRCAMNTQLPLHRECKRSAHQTLASYYPIQCVPLGILTSARQQRKQRRSR